MRLFLTGFLVGFVFLVGCGQNVKVTGKVTFEDGEPLTRGRVCFQTETFYADGPLQPDGTYTLGSTGENTGLPKGTYQVSITGAVTPPKVLDPAMGRVTPAVPLIHGKFTNQTTSGLTCEVKGRTVFDITVTPP